MMPRIDKINADAALPARADIVIIGGGIIGVSAAFFLSRLGIDVALCEKGYVAASNRAATGAGCAPWGAISPRSRFASRASGSGPR